MRNGYESGSKSAKYERCVGEVKGQRGVNPYAVCKSSVYKEGGRTRKSKTY